MTIKVEKSAQDWFFLLQKDNPENNKVINIGLKVAGCSGFEYTLKWEKEMPDNFIFTEIDNGQSKIKIGYLSIFENNLDGLTLKYEKDGISYKLIYDNPNVDFSCGCGESINFK